MAGAVITIDALHTQSDTAQVIKGLQADYVMTVNDGTPTLYKAAEEAALGRRPRVLGREH